MPIIDFSCSCGATKESELVRRDPDDESKYLDWDTKEPVKCDCGLVMEKQSNLKNFPYMYSGGIHKSANNHGGQTVSNKSRGKFKGR